MTIECHSCHARFHLDDSLFGGSKGMRIRCRKCGESIVVMNPKAPPSPPRAEVQSAPLLPRSKDPPPELETDVVRFSTAVPETEAETCPQEQRTVTPAPPDPVCHDTEESPPEQEQIGASPEGTAAPRNNFSEQEMKVIDDLFVPSKDDVASDESEMSSLQPVADSTRSEKRGPPPPIHRPMPSRLLHKRPTFIIAILLFLLLGGGAAYLGFPQTGKKLLHRLAIGTESLLSGGATTFPHYTVRHVSTYYVPRMGSEKLFVLEGSVENRGRTVGRGIHVQVSLLNGTSQVVATKTVTAGLVFTDEELRHMGRTRIEEGLSNRRVEDPTDMEIPPGTSLPFMAPFFDLKESIAYYQTTVQGAQ